MFVSALVIAAVLSVVLPAASVRAASYTASVSGNWSSTSTWGGSGPPTSADSVTINSGITVTVDGNYSCASITFNAPAASGGITISGTNTLTVSGAITMNTATAASTTTLSVGTGTLNAGSITINGANNANRRNRVTVSSGTISCTGNITTQIGNQAASNVLDIGSGTLNIGGNLTRTTGTMTVSSGTVNCNGTSAQTIAGLTYTVLKINNTTGVTLGAAANITTLTIGDVTSSSVFKDGAFTITPGTSSVLNMKNSSTYNVGAAALPAWGTYNLDPGTTVAYTGGNQNVSATPTYQNLTLSGSSTKTLATPLVVRGNFSSSTGTIGLQNPQSFSLGGNWNSSSALSNNNRLDLTLNGTGDQTVTNSVSPFTLRSLIINKSGGTATLAVNVATSSALTMTTGILDISTFTLSHTGGGSTAVTAASGTTIRVGGTNSLPTTGHTYTLNTASTVEYYGSAQTVAAITYGNLTLSGSGAKTTTGATVNGVLSIEGTATTTGTAATYGSAATLQYKGSNAQTTGIEFTTPWVGTGGVKIENASGVTLNAAKVINSSLTIGSTVANSVFNDGGYQLTSTATLNLISGTFKLGSGGSATTFPAFGTMSIAAGTTVEYAAGIAQIVSPAPNYHNLVISGSSIKTLGGVVNVNGTLNIGSGATLDASPSNYNMTIKGNWSNSGIFTARSGTVTLGGLNTQIIDGSAITNFFNLAVNNASGVTLNSSQAVGGTLTLTSGKIATGANTLIITTGGSISGGGNSSYVNGNLRKDFNSGNGQSFTFTIGDVSAYTPVALTSMDVATAGYLTVRVTGGDHPDIATSGIDSSMSVNRYWTLTPGGGLVVTYNATFNYLSSDLDGSAVASAFAVRRYSSGAWSASTVIGTPTNTALTIIGEAGFGDFVIGNTPYVPSISVVGLYQADQVTSVTAISPQTEYAVKVSVSDAGTLALLNTVKVTIFYDSDGVYMASDVPSSGNPRTAAILTCTVGSTPSWSITPDTNTTWSIMPASSIQPSLTNTSGDFWFHFKAGKVATATSGASKWHIYARATSAGGTADNYQDNRTMNWYGEVIVSTTSINFGTVSLGSDFGANQQTGISVTYISNGNYSQQVKVSSPWTGISNSVVLNTAGNPGDGEFSIMANSTPTLGSAVLVSTSYVTIGTGTQTDEGGYTVSTNTLWLKLGASGLPAVTYNGIIYYGIAP